VNPLFQQWLDPHVPDKAARIRACARDSRGGKNKRAHFGSRMTGQGGWADWPRQPSVAACSRLRLRLGLGRQRFAPQQRDIALQIDVGDLDLWRRLSQLRDPYRYSFRYGYRCHDTDAVELHQPDGDDVQSAQAPEMQKLLAASGSLFARKGRNVAAAVIEAQHLKQ